MIKRRLFLVVTVLVSMVSILAASYIAFELSDKPEPPKPQVSGVSSYEPKKEEVTTPDIIPVEPTYGQPAQLVIPKINVDSGILNMGLTPEGDMEVPERIEDLGWYKNGPHPGNEGSAVIAGHLGVGRSGIFVNLHKLEKGDIFWVIDDNDKKISFVVRETKIYDPSDHPEEVFFSDNGHHLNLITCAGKWDKADQGMTERLVVFADKI